MSEFDTSIHQPAGKSDGRISILQKLRLSTVRSILHCPQSPKHGRLAGRTAMF